jgi:hypothetical protein
MHLCSAFLPIDETIQTQGATMDEIVYKILLRRIQHLGEAERCGRSTNGRADRSLSRAFERVGWGDAALYYSDSPEGQRERGRLDRLMQYIKDGGDLGGWAIMRLTRNLNRRCGPLAMVCNTRV